MSVEAMSNVDDSTALQQGVRIRTNSGTDIDQSEGTENADALYRPEYPAACIAPSFTLHTAGPCNSFYGGPGQIRYPDYSDRFSVGYQRMGQTITLTSHKIQFGCQSGHPRPSYGRQRFSGPGYNPQYHMIQQRNGKPWVDVSMERPSTTNPPKPNNRGRTTYSDDQIAELERVFSSNPYPTSQTRQHLAYKIDVPEGKVKIWFQNRRARAKKSKLGCGGGGGSWRPSHNDSRNCEERTNQNNNNDKECSKPEPLPISINSILPLPTKTSINTLGETKWNAAGSSHPWRDQFDDACRGPLQCRMSTHSACSSAHGCCQCETESGYSRKTKPYHWNSNDYNPQQYPVAYRHNQMFDNSRAKDQLRGSGGPISSWNHSGTFGSVPDLVTQTSRVGINEANVSGAEGDLKVGGNGALLYARALGEPDCFATAPLFNVPMSATGFMPHEKHPSYFAEELSSPPPIRRMIFPFHTLTEARSASSDNAMSAGTVGFDYPPTRNANLSDFHGVASTEPTRFSENYQPYTFVKPTLVGDAQFQLNSTELGTFTQMQRAHSKWEASRAKASNTIPEIRDSRRDSSVSTTVRSGRSPRIPTKDDEDDDDDTDDAIDEPGMNDCATGAEDKPNLSLPKGESDQFVSSCWNERQNSNILVRAMEYAGGEDLERKRSGDSVGSLANLDSGMVQPVDASGIWTNQFVSGIYPSASASMVG